MILVFHKPAININNEPLDLKSKPRKYPIKFLKSTGPIYFKKIYKLGKRGNVIAQRREEIFSETCLQGFPGGWAVLLRGLFQGRERPPPRAEREEFDRELTTHHRSLNSYVLGGTALICS